ncbi:hypothetical protein B0H99_107129 [Planomicrobium soli]|uniref:Uncharacterized protein n=1 Tax=Planomicrobium soli TaxID=1176648 RepID=A0A2P8GQS0_9BACL|nr:hypothetical protein [Planomicrobium soli]PSL36308.1 hypothetical protein B0H99_107129 [Planomicrobium soli]
MKLEDIKNLLKISCNFNISSISHSFMIGEEDIVTVKCLKETFILEVTSSKQSKAEYYLSIDQAAQALYEKIHSTKTD